MIIARLNDTIDETRLNSGEAKSFLTCLEKELEHYRDEMNDANAEVLMAETPVASKFWLLKYQRYQEIINNTINIESYIQKKFKELIK